LRRSTAEEYRITPLSSRFLSLLLLLLLGTVFAVMHTQMPRDTAPLRNLARVTTLPGMALGSAWYEPRIRAYRDYRDTLFTELPPIDTMRNIYAQ